MNDNRNYDATGASEGSGGIWVTIDATLDQEPKFVIGKEKERVGNIAGYLEPGKFDIKWSDGNAEKNVEPGWEIVLGLSVKDDKRGVETNFGTEEEPRIIKIALYNFSVRMTHNTMMPSVLNVLAATDMNWNGYLSFGIYRKTDKPARLIVRTDLSQGQGDYARTKYPFDEASFGWIGVPRAIDTGVKVGNKPIYNYWEVRNFWLNEAKEFYARWNGKAYTGNIGPCGPTGYVTGKPEGTGVNTPPPPPPSGQLANTTNVLPSKKESFYEKLNAKMAAMVDPLTIVTEIGILYKQMQNIKLADYDTNVTELANAFNKRYWDVTGDVTGHFEGGKIVPGTTDMDQLPF